MTKQKQKERVATDPGYARTRENIAEFEGAAKAGRLFNDAFRMLSYNSSDERVVMRLSRQMVKALKADTLSDRGMRNVALGDISVLRDFEFNGKRRLASIFFAPYLATIDRAAGTMNINVPDFIPDRLVKAPPGTTHFALVSAAAAIDFMLGTFTSNIATTPEMALGNQLEPAVSLSNTVPPNSTLPLFLALGVKYFQQVNNKFYALNNASFNALAIVQADIPAQ